MLTNPIIAGQAARLTTSRVSWAGLTLVCVVHLDVQPSYAEVWKVSRSGFATLIGRSEPLGKDDSAGAEAWEDGTVQLWVAEADPGTSGSTSKVHYYDFPGAVPVAPPPSNGTVDTLVRNVLKAVRTALAPIP